MISELDYVLEHFDERFNRFCGQKIVLHGSRNYAEGIIARFDEKYQFAGVMTFDDVGTQFCGKPIFSEDQLERIHPDLIILTERVKYAEEAYRSLLPACRKNNIQLYNMYGLNEIDTHIDIQNSTIRNYQSWIKAVGRYDILVLEAMDTYLYSHPLRTGLSSRAELRRVAAWAVEQGIPVYFSLRKSYPEEKQIEALREDGLFPDDLEHHLIRRTGEDLSFRRFTEEHSGRRIMYVGSGLVNECILPRCYGYDTYRYVYNGTVDLLPRSFPHCESELKELDELTRSRKEELIKAISESDIVSFDVFDTLICRRVLYPTDVFQVVENRLASAGISIENYAAIRMEAERETPYGKLDDIYETMMRIAGISQETAKTAEKLELQTEKDLLMVRSRMAEILQDALRQGKEVVLTTDMYLPADVIEEILHEKGITGFSRIFDSCEYKCAKFSGLYNVLSGYARGRKVIHIGDNYEADVVCAGKYGIPAIHVPSVLEKALSAGWKKVISECTTVSERCLTGLAIAYSYNDPFAPTDPDRMTDEEKLKRYGYAKMGPLIVAHGIWLINILRNSDYDRVLFYARDGYLPILFYREVRDRYLKDTLPEALYFHTNRHSAFAAAADLEPGIPYFAELGKNVGLKPAEILKSYYNIPEEMLREPSSEGMTTEEYISQHLDIIAERAKKLRAGYEKFLNNLGIRNGRKYATVDFIGAGTAQMYLQEFTGLKMDGLFFGYGNYEVGGRANIRYYLKGENGVLLNNYVEMEGFMTSMEPSLDYIDENGSCVYASEPRTEDDFRRIRTVHKAVREYLHEYASLFYFANDEIRPIIPEDMYTAGGYLAVMKKAYDDWGKFQL